jgi:DNA (cytosine-5)-methyltransferase 1
VVGKCYLVYSDNLNESIEEWSAAGPNRFYFSQMYINKDEEFDDPPAKACSIGKMSKKNDKLKSKSKKLDSQSKSFDTAPEFLQISNKLRTLDVFAGCGGK